MSQRSYEKLVALAQPSSNQADQNSLPRSPSSSELVSHGEFEAMHDVSAAPCKFHALLKCFWMISCNIVDYDFGSRGNYQLRLCYLKFTVDFFSYYYKIPTSNCKIFLLYTIQNIHQKITQFLILDSILPFLNSIAAIIRTDATSTTCIHKPNKDTLILLKNMMDSIKNYEKCKETIIMQLMNQRILNIKLCSNYAKITNPKYAIPSSYICTLPLSMDYGMAINKMNSLKRVVCKLIKCNTIIGKDFIEKMHTQLVMKRCQQLKTENTIISSSMYAPLVIRMKNNKLLANEKEIDITCIDSHPYLQQKVIKYYTTHREHISHPICMHVMQHAKEQLKNEYNIPPHTLNIIDEIKELSHSKEDKLQIVEVLHKLRIGKLTKADNNPYCLSGIIFAHILMFCPNKVMDNLSNDTYPMLYKAIKQQKRIQNRDDYLECVYGMFSKSEYAQECVKFFSDKISKVKQMLFFKNNGFSWADFIKCICGSSDVSNLMEDDRSVLQILPLFYEVPLIFIHVFEKAGDIMNNIYENEIEKKPTVPKLVVLNLYSQYYICYLADIKIKKVSFACEKRDPMEIMEFIVELGKKQENIDSLLHGNKYLICPACSTSSNISMHFYLDKGNLDDELKQILVLLK